MNDNRRQFGHITRVCCEGCALRAGVSLARASLAVTVVSAALTGWWLDHLTRALDELTASSAPSGPHSDATSTRGVVVPMPHIRPGQGA